MILLILLFTIVSSSLTQPQHNQPKEIVAGQIADPPTLTTSPLETMLDAKARTEPQLTDAALAAYANELLAQYGYNFRFDSCEGLVRRKPLRAWSPDGGTELYAVRFARKDGAGAIEIRAEVGDAPCGECFFDLPAFGYDARSIELAYRGKPVRVRRLAGFAPEQTHDLVDVSLRRVIRRWRVPEQNMPLGISADGQTLYLYFATENVTDRLALALDENSRLSFVPLAEADKKGEEVKEHPKVKGNDYLSFIKFRVSGKTYVVRYTAPCT